MSEVRGGASETVSGGHRWYWILSLFTLLLFTLANSRPFQYSDSAAHYYEGLLVAEGGRPFIDFIENKNPAMYYLSALPALVGGWDMRFGVYFFRFVDILALVAILRLLPLVTYDRRVIGVTFLSVIIAYSSLFWFGKESIYVEPIEIICFAGAYHSYLSKGPMFLTGLLLGTGLSFRQTAVLDILVVLIHLIVVERNSGSIRKILALLFGASLPLILFVNIALTEGWADLWWKYAYEWNASYKQFDTPAYFKLPYSFDFCFGKPHFIVFSVSILIWLTFLASDLIRPVKVLAETHYQHTEVLRGVEAHKSMHIFLLLALSFHLFAVTASSVIHLHHCLVLLPPYAMIMAYSLTRLETATSGPAQRSLPYLQKIVIALCAVNLVVFGARCLRSISGRWVHLEAHAARIDFLGRLAGERSTQEERILAWGWAPELYLAARRHSASAFVHNLILSNWRESFLPLDEASLRKFERDLHENKPRLIFLMSELDIQKYFRRVHDLYDLETVSDPLGEKIGLLVRRTDAPSK